jgi:hypothetical protein
MAVTPYFATTGNIQAVEGELEAHETNTSNPHVTTASQVGALTQAQADLLYDATGEASSVAGDLASHESNTSNPHSTTYTQVGAPPANHASQHATIGADPITPVSIGAATNGDLTSHTGNTSNPHSTTYTQVGAPPSLHASQHATIGSDPITPANIGAATSCDLSSHTTNTSNPHSVTAAQTGAQTQTQADLLYDTIGAASVVQGNLNTHTSNTSNPHSVTASQVGALTQVDADLLYDSLGAAGAVATDLSSHTSNTSNPHQVVANQIPLPRIGSSTGFDMETANTLFNSTGLVSGGIITNNGDGTIAISSGSGYIRATDDETVQLQRVTWNAVPSLALTSLSNNWIYLSYNAGTPIIVTNVVRPTDYNTNIVLGNVYKDGILHINMSTRVKINNHPSLTAVRLQGTSVYTIESGEILAEVGIRNISVTSGILWSGLYKITTSAFNSSTGGNFIYVYSNGAGGWTYVPAQTQINNTQYDDGDGSLATLGGGRYGVHWVYRTVDEYVYVKYGTLSATLTQAQNLQPPSSIPPEISYAGWLTGKIIILKNSSVFVQVESRAITAFQGSIATDHANLANLQGGVVTEYYHLTSAQHTALTGITPIVASGNYNILSDGLGGLSLVPFEQGGGLATLIMSWFVYFPNFIAEIGNLESMVTPSIISF